MPKQTTSKQQSVADAERTLAECEQQKARLEARRHELEREGDQHARDEIAGNKAASPRLDEVVREKLRLDALMRAQDAAIADARGQLAAAQQREAKAADRAEAAALWEKWSRWCALAARADAAHAEAVAAVNEMAAIACEIGVPSWKEFEVHGHLAENTALMGLEVPRGGAAPKKWMVAERPIQFLAPNQRRLWAQLAEMWTGRVRVKMAALLGEQVAQTTSEPMEAA